MWGKTLCLGLRAVVCPRSHMEPSATHGTEPPALDRTGQPLLNNWFHIRPQVSDPVAIQHWPQVQSYTELCFRLRIFGVPKTHPYLKQSWYTEPVIGAR